VFGPGEIAIEDSYFRVAIAFQRRMCSDPKPMEMEEFVHVAIAFQRRMCSDL
jgi:hypothetical protein